METIVHRADLRTPPPATLCCLKSEEELTQRLAAIYGPVATFSASIIPVDAATSGGCNQPSALCQKSLRLKNDDHEKNEVVSNVVALDKEYNFYLFRNSGESSPQKIILEQDQNLFRESGLDHKYGGFLVPQRNRGYYFTSLVSSKYKEQLVLSAVDGETVKHWSRKRAWGLEVPWRVQVLRSPNNTHKGVTKDIPKACLNTMESSIDSKISMSSEVSKIQSQVQEKHTLGKRKKPSKKDRISMRKKRRAALATEEQRVRLKELKEQAEKEKKIRRNREKKIKRKIKKKMRKGDLEDIDKI
ncbi:hypothetical protein OnM2_023064 [Erysiphe neolycopersici]|uniref:Uncharacterized protein n=1 Tax=Erysiphe neolycopersici TaxID=212602 RepID=A0A420I246_9PEZI|nr:hypothetical protein OnM2_023064 [Erysiphe neolycopersici]